MTYAYYTLMGVIIGYCVQLLLSPTQNDPGCTVPGGVHRFYVEIGNQNRGCKNWEIIEGDRAPSRPSCISCS